MLIAQWLKTNFAIIFTKMDNALLFFQAASSYLYIPEVENIDPAHFWCFVKRNAPSLSLCRFSPEAGFMSLLVEVSGHTESS
jgi:hypothetical protein